jgi:hypothetical protein
MKGFMAASVQARFFPEGDRYKVRWISPDKTERILQKVMTRVALPATSGP